MQSGMERFSAFDIVLNLVISFLMGMFIFWIYRKTFVGVLYQRSFNISLVITTMITSLVIMTISGNLVLSLGMVGALSIVRFRTPIKDPIDLVFIFWAISVGIANGVGYYNMTIIGSIVVGLILMVLTRKKETDNAYLLVLHIPPESDELDVLKEVKNAVTQFCLKSKSIHGGHVELSVEVRLKDDNTRFLNKLESEKKVKKATLVSYSGDLAAV